ncbi:hypothetical protein FCU45_07595 [Sulfurimonas crateris]|uniref:Uncharacterized protein n=1 Tax=Sulfurimonas crateris TaxID=2574727 RepID=A0A4U2Z7B1_9BACT|nr:hypothetical protein [Sulfurimonas crateris]TKI69370.1 hypothetical protein FCU45_07595 [Sulfurimonas crateris]
MKITKIINAKTDQGSEEIQELIKYFGTYCISSSEKIAQEIQEFINPLRLAEYLDEKQKQGLITDVDELEHIDCIVDLSDKADEASLELFGYRTIDIIKKYPQIYGTPPYDPMKSLLSFGFEVGRGWFPLIAKLSEDIQKILDSDPELNIRVVQVKEKYGSLRFYAHGDTGREIDALIEKAEEESENICENCGKPAVPQKSKGWIKTRCEECADA